MEELIDVVDYYGVKTGIVKPKSMVIKDGDYHRAISILIMNSDDEILFQKRSAIKKVYPNLWSMFLKGHIKSGETVKDASIREIKEEIGVDVLPSELEYLYTIRDEKQVADGVEKILFDTFLLVKDIALADIKLNDEVSNVQFVTKDDAIYLIESNNPLLVPNKEDYSIMLKYLKEKEYIKEKNCFRR